jgi:putative transposase
VKYGKPEIMNTDQGSQYTGSGWITTLTEPKIKVNHYRLAPVASFRGM